MPLLGKLLAVALAERTLSKSKLFRQLLRGMAGLIILSIVLGLLTGAFLVSAVCVAYHALLLNGLEPLVAQATIGAVALLLIGIIYCALQVRIARVQRDATGLLRQQSPISSRLNDVADSFMNGLLEPTIATKE